MTHTPEHDPPLTAQQEAAVRRALSRAGGPEPMPEEVSARLDRVITDLAAERAGDDAAPDAALHAAEGRVVVPLDAAARRRRTRVRLLLGAAAVVVAGGVAAGVVSGDGSGADSMTAGTASDRPARGEEGAAAGGKAATDDQLLDAEVAEDAADGVPGASALRQGRRVVTDEPLRQVRPEHLRADLLALQATLPRGAKEDYAATSLRAPRDFMCPGAGFGAGHLIGIEYAAKPAVVAFREPVGASQVAEVLACGTADVLHSTTLPAP